MSALTIPIYNFPFSNLADGCLIDELAAENIALYEINISKPLDSIFDPTYTIVHCESLIFLQIA